MPFIIVVVAVGIITHRYNQRVNSYIPYEVKTKKEFYVDCLCGKLEQHLCEICNGEGKVLVDVQVKKESYHK